MVRAGDPSKRAQGRRVYNPAAGGAARGRGRSSESVQRRILEATRFRRIIRLARDRSAAPPRCRGAGGHRRGSGADPRARPGGKRGAAALGRRRAADRHARARQTERRVRRAAAARGLNEAVTWSFLPQAQADHFTAGNGGLWVLDNPISDDMKVMRPSLLPGLIAAAKRNADRGATGSRLFEIGRAYLRGDAGLSDERSALGLVLAGEKAPRGWASGKADIVRRLRRQGRDAGAARRGRGAGRQAAGDGRGGRRSSTPGNRPRCDWGHKTVLARFGALHPLSTLEAFDVEGPVVAAEIYLDAIPARKGS